MNLGKALVYARKMKGISQNQLARDSGTNRGYLYKLENDRISPTINKVERLCETLDITVSDLVEIAEKQAAKNDADSDETAESGTIGDPGESQP
jgi:transcriptional regulator with XRE-family HTH domain